MKRILVMILVLLVLFAGCRRAAEEPVASTESIEFSESEEDSAEESSEASQDESAAADEDSSAASQEPEEEEEALPPAPEELLRRLDLFDGNVIIFGMLDIGEGQILLETMDAGSGSDFGTMRFLRMDITTGTVLCEGTPKNDDEYILGFRPDGELLTYSYNSEEINFYDTDLQLIRTEAKNDDYITPTFDSVGDCFYSLDGDALYKTPASSSPLTHEKEPLIKGLRQAYLSTMNSENGWVLLQEPDDEGEMTRYTLYDGVAKEERISVTGYLPSIVQCEDHLLLRDSNWQEDDSENWMDVYRISDGEKTASYAVDYTIAYYASCRSPYVLYQTPNDVKENGESVYGDIILSDPVEGRYTDLDLSEDPGQLANVIYLESTRRWLLVTTNDSCSTIWELAAEYVALDQEYTPYQAPETSNETHELGEALADCRAEADQIEAAFGVRILLGDEVLDHSDASAYRYISIEDPEYTDGPEYDASFVKETLGLLRNTLAQYPKGFFDVFKNRFGEGGVRFLLVRDLANDDGAFIPGGEQFTCGIWYNVSLDIDSFDGSTVHHELWHAVDSLLVAVDNGVEYLEWEKLDPPDFSYGFNFDTYIDDGEDYEKYLIYGADPWFVSFYSLVTDNEDRATLVELAFSPYEYTSTLGECTGYEAIQSNPHLKAKLDYLAEKVNALFGYVYWDVMLQE